MDSFTTSSYPGLPVSTTFYPYLAEIIFKKTRHIFGSHALANF